MLNKRKLSSNATRNYLSKKRKISNIVGLMDECKLQCFCFSTDVVFFTANLLQTIRGVI